jgi:hypothetical protein
MCAGNVRHALRTDARDELRRDHVIARLFVDAASLDPGAFVSASNGRFSARRVVEWKDNEYLDMAIRKLELSHSRIEDW